jgi:hypothetical protein
MDMTTPHVTELPLALEPTTPDPFIAYLAETVQRDGGAPPRPAAPTGEVLSHAD